MSVLLRKTWYITSIWASSVHYILVEGEDMASDSGDDEDDIPKKSPVNNNLL